MEKEMVTITVDEYIRLKKRDYEFSCYESLGVDNWSGQGEANSLYWNSIDKLVDCWTEKFNLQD